MRFMGVVFQLMEQGNSNSYRANSWGFHNIYSMREMKLSSQRLIERGSGRLMGDVTFMTEAGHQLPALTEDQMREVDRIAMEDFGLGVLQMMENAGRNLALHAIENVDDPSGEIVILAGSGGKRRWRDQLRTSPAKSWLLCPANTDHGSVQAGRLCRRPIPHRGESRPSGNTDR